MALEAGVLHAIAKEKERSINADALAKKTGYDALLIGTRPHTSHDQQH